MRINGHAVEVKAQVNRYHLSAHASSADLQYLVRALHPRTVILIHGNRRFSGEPEFIRFQLELERIGVHVHQSANGVPIYL